MPETKIEEIVCEDKISALPEDLLVAILLLIPTKDAIATMILSKRWRFTWTMLPRLEYKDNEEDIDESKNSICCFLDMSLQLHKAPLIDTLCMALRPRCPIGKCIEKSVDRRVCVLKFKLLWSKDPMRLPKSLYTCETLVELTLGNNILLDLPSSSCLPSLKLLKLHYLEYKDEHSLLRFLSSCPVLKSLWVLRKRNDNVKNFTVKVPSSCSLYYGNSMYNDVGVTNGCLVIDTPALDRFGFYDSSGDYCSIKNRPCLADAYIHVKCYPGDGLLRSLSLLSSLELYLISDELLVRCSAINFSRLIKLVISTEQSDYLEPLMLLLGNAPKLKTLMVNDVRILFLF